MMDEQYHDNQNPVRVKICGLTSLEDARYVSGALADFIGFIFYEESPRYVDPARVGAIVNWIEGPEVVGVFVDQPPDDVNMIVQRTGLDMVQLHGNETPEYCGLMDKPVIKTFHVDSDTTVEELAGKVEPYLPHVEYLLFDTRRKGLWGGTGETFDWKVLQTITREKPLFLSGGLTPENVQEACRMVSPFAIDVNSGVEQAPGIKDYDKLEQLFDRVQRIRQEQEG